MKQLTADTVDRYAILLVKAEHGLDVDEELKSYTVVIPTSEALRRIHQIMWDLEDLISGETNLQKIGAYYLALRGLSRQRTEIKNMIARQHNEPTEQKNY